MSEKSKTKLAKNLKIIGVTVLIAVSVFFSFYATRQREPEMIVTENAETETVVTAVTELESETETQVAEEVNPEESVYTFLQGPVAWETQTDWSGSWCQEIYHGKKFGAFGCGMCCMANIYDTLSPYEVNPLEMYTFATEYSGYSPTKKVSAIGWGDLKTSLQRLGFSCDVYYKNETYEEFQENVKNSKSMIALVSSYCDDTFWKDTSGHYVNLWLYNEKTDQVFLAEPGDPETNRTWIPLRYVYDALKTTSSFQYLLVDSYSEENNIWKQTGMDPDVEWTIPEYYKAKEAGE